MRPRKKGKYTTQLPGGRAKNRGVTRNKARRPRGAGCPSREAQAHPVAHRPDGRGSSGNRVYPNDLTVVEILKFAFGAVAGSTVLLQVVRHFIQRKKYETDVRRLEIENDGLVSEHWKNLYTELRAVQQEQARQIEQLMRENMELREKCEALQRQMESNLN
jgi:hypothetical protein